MRWMKDNWIVIAMVAGTLVLMVLFIWFAAYNEAASYRKYCDTPVTTWDAIFLDLRIDECERCDQSTGG